jgi:hypothetical protein
MIASGCPHCWQNFASSGFSEEQFEHTKDSGLDIYFRSNGRLDPRISSQTNEILEPNRLALGLNVIADIGGFGLNYPILAQERWTKDIDL